MILFAFRLVTTGSWDLSFVICGLRVTFFVVQLPYCTWWQSRLIGKAPTMLCSFTFSSAGLHFIISRDNSKERWNRMKLPESRAFDRISKSWWKATVKGIGRRNSLADINISCTSSETYGIILCSYKIDVKTNDEINVLF